MKRFKEEPAQAIVVARPALSDIPGIVRCLADYRFHVFGASDAVDPDYSREEILHVRNGICSVDLQEKSWVARREEDVLGFCCWGWKDRSAGAACTLLISVLHAARSLGVGSLLQDRRLDEMRDEGAREVHTWSDHPDAIRWYQQRYGYEQVGQQPIRHCIHCFRFEHCTFWGIHRGHVGCDQLTHLRLDLSDWQTKSRPTVHRAEAMPTSEFRGGNRNACLCHS